MSTKQATKRKVASGNDERGAGGKTARLSNDAKLITAINIGDFLTVRNVLENKSLKFSKPSLNAALQKAVDEGKKRIVQLLLGLGICVSGRGNNGCLALLAAVRHGYFDIVKELIKKGVPVDRKNSAGKTALMVAVEKSCCSALISYLLNDCKADPNIQDNEGKTALMLAVEQWDFETVQTLFISNSCDEHIKDKNGLTALDLAHRNGFADLLKVLSQSKSTNLPPINIAAESNNLDLVRQLLEICPSCVKGYADDGSCLTAAMHGSGEKWDEKIHCSVEILELLLQAGANVDDTHWQCGLTPLMFAATAGSETAVEKLLMHRADVNKHKPKQHSALMIAVKRGHAKIVEMLIKAGANLFIKNVDSENVLSLSVKSGNKACIHAVLKYWHQLKQQDVELMEEHGVLDVLTDVRHRWSLLLKDAQLLHKVLCKAIQARFYQFVQALIDHGANVNFCQTQSLCPLFLALDDTKMLHTILANGADVDARLSSGFTVLMQAAANGNVKFVNTLLKNKADMYAESNGSTALTLAITKNKPGVVSALLDIGVDVNHVSQDNRTPLWWAVHAKKYELTETLIERGASVNFASTGGVTVLMHAIKNCPVRFSELIIKSGAYVNVQDDNGDTALFHALQQNPDIKSKEEKIDLLLNHGADVNHINLSSLTPFLIAAGPQNKASILKILLRSQPDMNARDPNGDTAMHIAVRGSDERKLKMLVGSGADLSAVDREYRNPLMLALKNLSVRTVRLLLRLGTDANSVKSCPRVRRVWQADLEWLFDDHNNERNNYNNFHYHFFNRMTLHNSPSPFNFLHCVEPLLEAGFPLHDARAYKLDQFLATCIEDDEHKVVQLLIQCGFAPNLLDLSNLPEICARRSSIKGLDFGRYSASPLCIAILCRKPKIIDLFAQACFYHQKDVKMLQHRIIKATLQKLFLNWPQKDSSPLKELCPKNWSLQTWSKLVVQRAVGFGEVMEQRVRALPIPKGIQDEMLHKNITVIKGLSESRSNLPLSPLLYSDTDSN
ncbi:hypothetical protein RRG08_036964 [Elysia crispata]|uniref:Uncharacterized protein n=1 Tax=Elysia crispata TaxID=231223 RepID=A0AAE0XTP1_9GAST|nr:hypothetical protein RRG08_036964 [Elysia crispata]